MITILLYGALGKRFGRVHRYAVRNAAEAVIALRTNYADFRQALIDGGSYRVITGGRDGIALEQLHDPISQRNTVRIVPVIQGAGGLGRAIIGTALAVVGFLTGQPWLMNIGVSMALSGVSEMLFAKKPAAPTTAAERPENRPSYTFDGAVNTAAQGNPFALFYGGPLIVGSQVASAGLNSVQIS